MGPEFKSLEAVAITADGGFLVADRFSYSVWRIDSSGHVTAVAGTGEEGFPCDGVAATSTQLTGPTGVAVMADGGFLIGDDTNDSRAGRVHRVTRDGIITTIAGKGKAGILAQFALRGDGRPARKVRLLGPSAVAVTADGGFLITDCDCVRKVTADGRISTVAGTNERGFGGDWAPATKALLNDPKGLAVCGDGGFLIADTGNERVRRVAADGTMTTVAGCGDWGFYGDGEPAHLAMLSSPTDVAVAVDVERTSTDLSFLIADNANNRVRRVAADGIISTVAGTGKWGFSGGGPATAAQLDDPTAVAFTGGGGFVIACRQSVRKVSANGTITRLA